MSAVENRQVMQHICAELAKGNGRPFVDRLADDFCWTVMGSTAWSRTYRGKQAVRDELLRPLFAKFATRYTNTAHRILADGDHVVVECRGRVMTKSGVPYDNAYCWVCRIADGQLKELTEYADTDLIARVLGAP